MVVVQVMGVVRVVVRVVGVAVWAMRSRREYRKKPRALPACRNAQWKQRRDKQLVRQTHGLNVKCMGPTTHTNALA